MTPTEVQTRFQALVEEHRKILFKVCALYCKHQVDREDLAQEIVLQLWRSFRNFDDRCRFSTWMYRISLNVAISFNRRERTRTRHVRLGGETLFESIQETEQLPEDMHSLYQYVEALDPLNKALMLLYLDGNSYQVIAEVVGITETNVATKLSRLKAKMKCDLSTKAQE
jgi:RNA polymerase sigma factor (sigma-70 family)